MEQSTIQVNWITTLNCYFAAARGGRLASLKCASLFLKIKIVICLSMLPRHIVIFEVRLNTELISTQSSQRRLENIVSYFDEKLLFVLKCIWNFLDAISVLCKILLLYQERVLLIFRFFSLMINFFVSCWLPRFSLLPPTPTFHICQTDFVLFSIKNNTNPVLYFKGNAVLFLFSFCRHNFRWNLANIKHDFILRMTW